jgi:hypothetical protein
MQGHVSSGAQRAGWASMKMHRGLFHELDGWCTQACCLLGFCRWPHPSHPCNPWCSAVERGHHQHHIVHGLSLQASPVPFISSGDRLWAQEPSCAGITSSAGLCRTKSRLGLLPGAALPSFGLCRHAVVGRGCNSFYCDNSCCQLSSSLA